MQIIEISKIEKKPVVLLTDDAKEDWWQIHGDRTIGPRAELVAEFLNECGQSFYMYSSGRFLKHASTYLSETIEPDAIEEVVERLKEQLRNVSHIKPDNAKASENSSAEKPLAFVEKSEPENLKPTVVEANSQLNPQNKEIKK